MNMFQKMKFLCSTYCHRETEDIDEAISIIDDNMRAGWERELSGERKLSRDWGACLNIDK